MVKALVVEDEEDIRNLLVEQLLDKGCEVRKADNGDVALQRVSEEIPDIIFVDIVMPVMDGIDFLLALRKESNGDTPKVIFCTTENDAEHITRAITAGANEYIMKPFDRDIIEAKFQEVGLI